MINADFGMGFLSALGLEFVALIILAGLWKDK